MKLCHFCFKDWKQSKAGKQARKAKLNGDTSAPYGKDKWPGFLYHDEPTSLCYTHHKQFGLEVSKQYDDRDTLLKSMGFTSYIKYLQSELWVSIRKRILVSAGYVCEFCGSEATQVHHSVYDLQTLKGTVDDYLHAICGKCHGASEFRQGVKVGPRQATRKMKEIKRPARVSL